MSKQGLMRLASLQFLADAFNISNRPSFGIPNAVGFGTTGMPLGTTGVISTTLAHGGEIQFNLKLGFRVRADISPGGYMKEQL